MEPLTTLIGAKLLDWSTEKVADALLNGVTSKLNSKDLDKALKKATKAAHEQQKQLFIKCEPGLTKSFLEQFFTGSGLQELQKPLNNQGTPQLDFLVTAFKAALTSHPEMQGRVYAFKSFDKYLLRWHNKQHLCYRNMHLFHISCRLFP